MFYKMFYFNLHTYEECKLRCEEGVAWKSGRTNGDAWSGSVGYEGGREAQKLDAGGMKC